MPRVDISELLGSTILSYDLQENITAIFDEVESVVNMGISSPPIAITDKCSARSYERDFTLDEGSPEIEISFRPSSDIVNGVLFFVGNTEWYISIELQNGLVHLLFRKESRFFDIVNAEVEVKAQETSTISISVDVNKVFLIVNGVKHEQEIIGGYDIGLEGWRNFYLGGVADIDLADTNIKYNNYRGCISKFKIYRQEVDLKTHTEDSICKCSAGFCKSWW